MTEFQRLHIDLSQTLEPNAAKKLADPPGFSTAAGKEVSQFSSVFLLPIFNLQRIKEIIRIRSQIIVADISLSHSCNQIDVGGASSRKGQTELASTVKRQNALFAMATAPWKNVAMMSFMMYMAGTQLHFFSIMATINGLYSPFNAILKSGQSTFNVFYICSFVVFWIT